MQKRFAHRLLSSSSATAVLTLSSQAFFGAAANHKLGNQAAFLGSVSGIRRSSTFQGISPTPSHHLSGRMATTCPDKDALSVDDGDWNDILPYEKSSHNSATITIPKDDSSPMFARSTFRDLLEDTCTALRELQKSSVWVEVPMARASLIEEMVDLGFEFHHAHGTTAKLNMWLREDTECKVPEFATHHVGVGAVVVNSREEILCVREIRRNFMPWKVPGGLAELGESISEAAEREVLEETGIPTKFHSILSFRHAHGLSNGRSDLFFVCRLDPIEETDEEGNVVIPDPCAQECEIEDAQWIPFPEYRDMVHGVNGESGHPMMSHVMNVYDQGARIQPREVKSVVPGRKPNSIYSPDISELN
jgi:8-oxo-dGTP pyrophosphatase MutT (NUDIX family)